MVNFNRFPLGLFVVTVKKFPRLRGRLGRGTENDRGVGLLARRAKIFLRCFAPLVIIGCVCGALFDQRVIAQESPGRSDLPQKRNRLTQIATIDTLLSGCYDGLESLGELKRYGNFGLGTVHRIDGELTLLDGMAYRASADGSIHILHDDTTTPFASVTLFDKTAATLLAIESPLDFDAVTKKIDDAFPDQNIPIAILIEGNFSNIAARSEVGQQKPYRPLAETMKRAERRFSCESGEGAAVGFRTPLLFKGLNVPGYHFHYIDTKRQKGGHLVRFQVDSGHVFIQPLNEFLLIFPSKLADIDLSRDRTEELRQVEQSR